MIHLPTTHHLPLATSVSPDPMTMFRFLTHDYMVAGPWTMAPRLATPDCLFNSTNSMNSTNPTD